jgi:hypothetical protein
MLSNSQHEINALHAAVSWIYHDGFLLPFGCVQYPSDEFIIGLLTPANALFILSLPFGVKIFDSLIVLEI